MQKYGFAPRSKNFYPEKIRPYKEVLSNDKGSRLATDSDW